MLPIHTVLHATDFSPASEPAFQLACSLARDYAARLILLHVVEAPVSVLGGAQALPPSPAEFGIPEATEKLNKMTPPFAEVRLERLLRIGEPVTEILQSAKENSCQLIVLGTHGRKGLSRLLVGSVAEAILRRAPCPVLTVRAPMPADAS
jgi:nucleotide-binding universal stress UspA family protein